MKKFTKKALLKHLQQSEKEDIVLEVVTLFEKFNNVKEFYKAELSSGSSPLLEQYKKKITHAYSTVNPSDRRTNMNVNRLLSQFKKISVYERDLAELHFHRVECALEALKKNAVRSEAYYNCLTQSFQEGSRLVYAMELEADYGKKMNELIKLSGEGKPGLKKRLEAFTP